MESLRELFKIGVGPSASHTMGPKRAAEIFLARTPEAVRYRVSLYGSLAATGQGHLTDTAIISTFQPHPVELVWETNVVLPIHSNGMIFEAYNHQGGIIDTWHVYSIGGGTLLDDRSSLVKPEVYPFKTMKDIMDWCKGQKCILWQCVSVFEDHTIWDFLKDVWSAMQSSIERGLQTEGNLQGGLHLPRKSRMVFNKSKIHARLNGTGKLFAYALAVAEENAGGGIVVTSPTCGSSGVLPAVLKYLHESENIEEKMILKALATAGLIGNVVKENSSISGAAVGCQGEIGTACAMAAAAASQLLGGTNEEIEYAAEMGLEHLLGLTCDPVAGLVQIPCIERNAFGASRALDCGRYSILAGGSHYISFDEVVKTMYRTGSDLKCSYRETSTGGLAYSHIIPET